MRQRDLSGQRFGRLVAISAAYKPVQIKGRIEQRASWLCQCDCGATTTVWTGKLTSGHTQSCGCLARERSAAVAAVSSRVHGGHGTVEYRTWQAILTRCYNPNIKNFSDYGGRGIRVCDRWRFGEDGKHPFECFLDDMGKRPSDKHSIDRYPNNDGNYEPGNCRWATWSEQLSNRRPHDNPGNRKMRGESHRCATVTEAQVREARRLAREGMQVAEIARKLQIHAGAARHIVKGRSWKHLLTSEAA